MAEGYCVKERKKVEIKDPQQVTMKNGRPAIQGTMPVPGHAYFVAKCTNFVPGRQGTRHARPVGALA